MSSLPSSPVFIFYNGVTFPTETETLNIAVKPVYDSSGRAVKYVVYEVTLRAVLTGGVGVTGGAGPGPLPADAVMADVRRRLTARGGEFHYEGVGFGQLSVNVPAAGPTAGGQPTPARDVIWGPTPRIINYKPMGQAACEITWVVEVAIPECGAAKYALSPMEFCFRLTFDIDRSGYTRRTYSGFVRIPQTRKAVDDRTLSDQADRVREDVNPPLMAGFRRTPGRFTLSEDKCRLDFEVVDEELPANVPPQGVVEVSASTTAVTGEALAGAQWAVTYNATYEMARDVPRSRAFKCFIDLLKDRVGGAGPDGKKPLILPRTLSVSEVEIYGRKAATFSATYQATGAKVDIVAASGMWRPVPGTDWGKWAASLAGTAFSPRGNAQVKLDANVDAIIDLCGSSAHNLSAGGLPPPAAEASPYSLETSRPDPKYSYISYGSIVHPEDQDEVHELKTLPPAGGTISTEPFVPIPFPGYGLSTGASANAAPPGPSGSGPGTQAATIDSITVDPSQTPPVVQTRAYPSRYVFLRGYGVRAGYPVEIPDLVSVGNAAVTRACRVDRGEGVWHWLMATWFGVPVYAARWNIRYLVAGRPTSVKIPPNPYISE